MRKLILFLCILFLSTYSLWAEDVRVEATVNTSQLTMGEAGQLTLSIHGVKNGIEPPQWPKIDGIETTYVGPSTSISIINGQYSSLHAYNYSIFPSKTGHIQIPVLSLTIEGKTFATKPIDIDISDSVAKPQPATGSNPAANDSSVSLKDKVFMVVSTPQASVYLGQKVPIRIKLYINQLPIRTLQFPKLEEDGFTLEGFPQPPQYNEVVNGVNHTVVDYQGFIYPTRTGALNIGPIHLDGSLLYKSQRTGGGRGFFSDDLLSSMFETYQERPITINTDPLKINSLPLPTEGKPSNFTGAVGQVNFAASISPQEVHIGDPVTLRMQLSGVANYKSLHMPEFNDARFKTYDPVVKDGDNSRSVEQVIIPNSETVTQVPAIAFNYFDPSTGEYKMISQGPFGLKVSPIAKDQEFKAVGFSDLSKTGIVKSTEQVDYVKQYLINPIKYVLDWTKRWQFWAVLVLLIVLWLAWLVSLRFKDRLQNDTAFARRHRALQAAKKGIKQAEEALNRQNPKDFYHVLVGTLNRYIADKVHTTSASLSLPEILAILQKKNISPIVVESVKAIYENADLVQYASGQVDQHQMKTDLQKLNAIIVDLEKKL